MAQRDVRAPVWARQENRRRSTLSRESIVAAAVAVADAEGLEAVSIRRVAADLNGRAMSLYTYIGSKEDLLDLMADEVAAETLVPGELPADWREATLAIARRQRACAARHPWLIEVARRSAAGHVGPNALRHLEQSVAALDGLQVGMAEKRLLITAVTDYLTGVAVREARERAAARSGEDRVVEPYLRDLAAGGEHPHLAALLAEDPPSEDDTFEGGLRWLLDGFARG